MADPARTTVYRLLSQALAEMDAAVTDAGDRALARVLELFRDLPERLGSAARGNDTYPEILAWLRDRAEAVGLRPWLEAVINEESRWADGDRGLLYRLLSVAVLTVRVEAYTADNRPLFRLADLFHNVPSRLNSALRDQRSHAEILSALQEHAARNGSVEWLDQALHDATSVVAR